MNYYQNSFLELAKSLEPKPHILVHFKKEVPHCKKKRCQERKPAWWFKVTLLGWLSDPFKDCWWPPTRGWKAHFESPGYWCFVYIVNYCSRLALGKSYHFFHGFCGFGFGVVKTLLAFFLAMMGGYLVLGVRLIWFKGFFSWNRCRMSKAWLYPLQFIWEIPELPETPSKNMWRTTTFSPTGLALLFL